MKRIITLTLLTGLFIPCVSNAVDLPKIDRKKAIQFLKDKPAEIAVGVAGIAGTIMALVGYAKVATLRGPVNAAFEVYNSSNIELQTARETVRTHQAIVDSKPKGWLQLHENSLERKRKEVEQCGRDRYRYNVEDNYWGIKHAQEAAEKEALNIDKAIAPIRNAAHEVNIATGIIEQTAPIVAQNKTAWESLHAPLQRYRLLMYAGIVLAVAATGYGIHKAIEYYKTEPAETESN